MILRIIFPKYTEQFKAIFIFLVILFCVKNNYGQRFNSDNYEYRDNLRINAKTGVAEVMYSTDNISYEGIPEEIARQFLTKNKNIFGIENTNTLKLIEIIESPGGEHVGFIQTYEDIPIINSETVVSINEKNQVLTVSNGCLPIREIKVLPIIDKETALNFAKQLIKLNERTLISKPKTTLNIYPDSLYVMHLVWKINISSGEPSGSWQIIIDANTGKVMKVSDIRARYITGTGKIFKPDPITALQNKFLSDMNNSDYPALQAAYKTVALYELNNPVGGIYRLQGKYARSEDIYYPEETVISSSSAFYFDRSQPGFEETNVYYFITTQQQYIGGLGFSPKWKNEN